MQDNNSITTTTTTTAAAAAAAAATTTTTPPPPPPVVVVVATPMAYRHDYTTHVAAQRAPAGRSPGAPPPRWVLAEPPRTTLSGLKLRRIWLQRVWRWLQKRCGVERVRAVLAKRKRE
ncbi:hypothetical protein KC318_g18716 [Hortaea werneckii]|nr:hypothetical protein KC334_g18707 [Hortaea werneckii]KAI7647322.1 hypothetical protein KC318_g18716 [Hortaea werneckii]